MLRLGAVSIAAVVLFARLLPTWITWEQERVATARTALEQLSNVQSLMERAGEVRDSLAARAASQESLEAALIVSETPAAAAASMSSHVLLGARVAGLAVGSSNVRHERVATPIGASARNLTGGDSLEILVMRLEAQGDTPALSVFLAWLEESPPTLAIREIVVSQDEIVSDETTAENLRIAVVVEGITVSRGPVQPVSVQRAQALGINR